MEQLIQILAAFRTIYIICIFAWALMSWLPMLSPQLAYNSTVRSLQRFLDSVVLPWVRLFRFIRPIQAGGMLIDLSALAAIFVFLIGSNLLLQALASTLVH